MRAIEQWGHRDDRQASHAGRCRGRACTRARAVVDAARDAQRCPSKWGAADQRGAGNHMKPETVLRAARLIRTGEVFELGRVLRSDMPFSAGRRFEMETKRTT